MLKIINVLTKPALLARIKYRLSDSVFALQIFNLARFLAMFLVSVYLVKIQLDVELIAGYEYVVFLSSIVTGWWIQGFLQSFMADTGMRGDKEIQQVFRDYSKLLVRIGAGIILFFAVVIELLAHAGLFQRPPEGFYLFLCFHVVLQAVIFIVYYMHRLRKTAPIYILAAYVMATYLGSFLLLLFKAITLPSVYTVLALLSIPIVLLWVILYYRPALPSRSLEYVPHLTTLMIIQGIGFISLWSDGFWVQYFYGTEEIFALFRYGGREFPLFIILTTTFSTAIIHRIQGGGEMTQIRNTSRRYILMFLPAAIALMAGSSFLFDWVFDEHFVPASLIFDLYLLLVLVRVLFPRPILIAHRCFRPLLWISVGELLFNVVLSYTFYWSWGIVGLIAASLAAHVFELGASIAVVYRKTGITPVRYIPIRAYLMFAITLFGLLWVKYSVFAPDWLVLFWPQ